MKPNMTTRFFFTVFFFFALNCAANADWFSATWPAVRQRIEELTPEEDHKALTTLECYPSDGRVAPSIVLSPDVNLELDFPDERYLRVCDPPEAPRYTVYYRQGEIIVYSLYEKMPAAGISRTADGHQQAADSSQQPAARQPLTDIVLKEWIYTEGPNIPIGSRYAWKITGAERVTRDEEGRVGLSSGERSYMIDPVVYWTKDGWRNESFWEITGGALSVVRREAEKPAAGILQKASSWDSRDSISFLITAGPADYPLLIDPTVNYGQWIGGKTGGAPTVITSMIYEENNSEIYVGGYTVPAEPFTETIVMAGSPGDNTEAFIIEIGDGGTPTLVWGQWIGGDGTDEINAVMVTDEEIYVAGYSVLSTGFESVTFQGAHSGGSEGFLIEIADGGTPSLVWGQWLGGLGNDEVLSLTLTDDEIYASGYSTQSTSFESISPFQGAHSGGTEGFVIEISDGGTPSLVWGQWLGGSGNDETIFVALTDDEIYAAGYSTQSTGFEAVTPFSGAHSGSSEGFVIEISDGGTPALVWGQWLGGTADDSILSVSVLDDEIYAAGFSSTSTSFDAVTFQGAHSGGSEGFVIEIGDGGTPALVWGQWLGGTGNDIIYSLNLTGDEIYAGGMSTISTSFESVSFAGVHTGGSEGFFVEIADGGTPSLNFAQWVGGDGDDIVYAMEVSGDSIYAAGYSTVSTSFENLSFQGLHNGGAEGFVALVSDGLAPVFDWGQWIGSTGGSPVTVRAMAADIANDEIYAGGFAGPEGIWSESVTTYGTFNGESEGFVIEIADAGTPALNWMQWFGGTEIDQVLALAVSDDEIYAGGYSVLSTGFESITFAGTNSGGGSEGFVVEIGDAGTPTLVWGQWLGGTNTEQVLALAVNGDEVYAAGFTNASTSFESSGSNQGALVNAEGFAVEIADGGTPTLTWRQWLGGNNADVIYALAVTNDEIYVGGYSDRSTAFEAVTFQGAFAGSSEGFVVEIGDGGTPTLVWGQWLGGLNLDTVYALAVTDEEIYAAGYSTQSTSFQAVTFQGVHSGSSEGFVIEIGDGGTPTLVWGQWLGGPNLETIYALAVTGDEVYAAGYSTQSTSFESITPFSGVHTGNSEGFVIEIADGGTPSLVWGQWLGGTGNETVYGMAITGDEVYAGGYAVTSTSFEAVTFSGTFQGITEGFVIEIGDGGTPTLAWGQWLGGGQNPVNVINAIALEGSEVYAGGYATQSFSFDGTTFQGTFNAGETEAFVVEVAIGGTPSLQWGHWLGGSDIDVVSAIAVTGDEIYAGGFSTRSTAFEAALSGVHSGGSEGFVVEIGDGGTPTLVWGLWFGGTSADQILALDVTGDEIYAAGYSLQSTSIETGAVNAGVHSGNSEGFVIEIADGGTPTIAWNQWIGGTSSDSLFGLAITDDEIYVGGYSTQSTGFEAVTFQGAHSGTSEGFVIEIGDGATPSLVWGQWIGGVGIDQVYSVSLINDEVYAGGYSAQSTSIESVTFSGAHNGGNEGFVVEIADGGTPSLVWAQWLGGSGNDIVYSLSTTDEVIYAGSYSTQSTSFEFPDFIKGAHSGSDEGFVAQITDGVTPRFTSLNWLGGNGLDRVFSVQSATGTVYAGGYAQRSTSFETMTFSGTHQSITEGFIVEIAIPTIALSWGQYLGAGTNFGTDRINALVINGDEIYAGGSADRSTSFEAFSFQGAHSAGSEGFVVEIGDGGTPGLAWGQWIGGNAGDEVTALAVIQDEIYAGGYSARSTSFETVAFNGAHSGSSEGFVMEIADGGTPALAWGQWLGGSGIEYITGLAVTGDEIYAAGYSTSTSTGTFEAVTFQGSFVGSTAISEGFVIEIGDGGTPTLVWGQWLGGNSNDQALALGIVNDEIYVGGYSVLSTGFESVTFQGANNGSSEGFVVEITDGGTPSLVWGQWLGGTSDDVVRALAVTGDEIYAGGYSAQSTGFEAVTFQGVHSGSSEGYVIEILDGDTPTLSWGQWIGGSAADEVLALSVVNTEIYAGGYSAQSTSFESFAFTGVHSGSSEGFMVEVRDGASVPTASWAQWFGGSGVDVIQAVALSGDEVYAGGYSVTSTSFEAITFGGSFVGTEGLLIEVSDDAAPGASATDNMFSDQLF